MIEFEKAVLYRDLCFILHYCGCFFQDVAAVFISASVSYKYDAAEFVRFSDSHCENNYFMVLQSVFASNLECLSKSFPVGATGIYLLDV